MLSLLNQKNSPLLRLPAELRNWIYSLVFDSVVQVVPWPYQTQAISCCPHSYAGPAASLLTCRQIYVEASGVLLRSWVFNVTHITTCNEALTTLGIERCNAIDSISLNDCVMRKMIERNWWRDVFHTDREEEVHFAAL